MLFDVVPAVLRRGSTLNAELNVAIVVVWNDVTDAPAARTIDGHGWMRRVADSHCIVLRRNSTGTIAFCSADIHHHSYGVQ